MSCWKCDSSTRVEAICDRTVFGVWLEPVNRWEQRSVKIRGSVVFRRLNSENAKQITVGRERVTHLRLIFKLKTYGESSEN